MIGLISFLGYSNFKNFYDESSIQKLQRDELLINLSLIRGKLLDSYKALNHFLLTPENDEYKKNIISNIKEASRISVLLEEHPWIIKYKRKDAATGLITKLDLLEQDVVELIRVRMDITNQYPSLAVGAEIMQPNRNSINNALALAVNEASNENTQIDEPDVFKTIIQIRHLWGQVLSNFRLYMANRVGSFNKSSLPIQEQAIEVMFKELQRQLRVLKKYADNGDVGFETTEAIDPMMASLEAWFTGFKKVKIIHHSDEWRNDAKIMKEIVSPRIDSIVASVVILENIISESSKYDMKSYELLSDSQNRMIWFIASLGLIFIITTILTLDRVVFKPIAMVSKALKFEALGRRSNDIPVVRSKETMELINAFSEMSRQVHLRQTELEYRALHDSLTSLPNRTLLLDRIKHDINTARRESHQLSLMIIDLDNFKEVNDTLGHIAGDNLLIEAGARIKNVLREVDTVARIGGDEFSVLLPHTDEQQAVITSKKILDSFRKSIMVESIDISISASIGIALYPSHGEDPHSLLRYADVAMYVAKRNKLGVEVYNEEQDVHSISRLSMTNDFRDALEKNKLSISYQPIFDIKNNNIVAVEALSRWDHPEHGPVSPDDFISLAEQIGLINNLTYWVLNESISQMAKWHKIDDGIAISVNLSVFSFKDPDFIDEVCLALKKHDFPSDKLKLEITESAMMENPLHAVKVLNELHSMGIKLSIDDFGTGFSSMAYLKQLPVDELKIDKSFVIGLTADDSDDAIVRSTIELAHNLNLQVVAEGIETKPVNRLLEKYKCDMVQGHYLSRPISANKLEKLLLTNKR